MSKKKPLVNKRKIVTLRSLYSIIFFVILFMWLSYTGMKKLIAGYLLEKKSIKTKGVIIDEKNYLPNSPVAHDYTYSYCFMVDGELYKDDSKNESFKVGDSVLVEYYPSYPVFNKIVQLKSSK